MVRILFLLCLYGISNNAKAYCYASQWENGIPVYSSLGVANNTTMESCQQLACQIFPQIPECSQPAAPACSNNVEFQSLACQPNYSGAINQSRTFYCESQSYSDWVTTSDNCTPNPPTCNYSVQEEQRSCGENQIGAVTYKREQNCHDPYGSPVDSGWFEIKRDCLPAPATCTTSTLQRTSSCSDGFTGSITQQQISSCPDQYGQPIFGAWEEVSNNCQKSVTNPMNVNSPVSPISPLNTMDVPATPVVEAPQAVPAEMTVETKETSTQSSRTVSETKEEKQEAPQKVDVPKGKELVNGFGLVMSLEIMNSPIQMQQQQLEIALEYTQELPYELRGSQGFLIEFITESNIADAFNNIANNRWNSLRSHYEVQPDF